LISLLSFYGIFEGNTRAANCLVTKMPSISDCDHYVPRPRQHTILCQTDDLEVGFESFSEKQFGSSSPSSPPPKASPDSVETPRLAGITIIAATSPDIKALNLPTTPAFPTKLGYDWEIGSSRRNSVDLLHEFQDVATPNIAKRTQSVRDSTSPFWVDSREDYSYDVAFRRPLARVNSSETSAPVRLYHIDDRDDLFVADLVRGLSYPSCPEQEEENINPNVLALGKQSKKKEGQQFIWSDGDDDCFALTGKKILHRRRKSLHRRDSTTSLPSPEEIGSSQRTPRRRNLSTTGTALFGDD
jgi:hypothetical protein